MFTQGSKQDNHGDQQSGGYPQQPYPGAVNSNQQEGYPAGYNGKSDQAAYGKPEMSSSEADMAATSVEDPEVKGFEFSDKIIRRGFIRKVYSILMVQLAITTAIMALLIFEPTSKAFVQKNYWLMFVALAVTIVAVIVLACCGEVRRKAPGNYILLIAFTIAEGFLLGLVSSFLEVEEVLMAIGITSLLCLGLTLFAFQTRFDFTMCGGFLFLILYMLIVFGIIASILAGTGYSNRVVNLLYSSLGALLFSVYLVYDTQLMMGGEHKYSISPEEYIFAALNLYLDIINIFLYILRILASR